MGAKVQSKTYFPGSIMDLNNGFHNSVWDVYHDDRSHKVPAPGNNQHYDYFSTAQPVDGYSGYAKEQIRQTILKQESVFRHQIHELHRLYKRQKDLMNPVSTEPLKSGHFLSQVPTDVSKEMHMYPSGFPLMNSSFSRASTSGTNTTFSPMDSIKGKSVLKCGIFDRRVIDLDPPADVDVSNKGNLFGLADLNEPVHMEARETPFSAFFSNRPKTDCFMEEPQKWESSAKRTLFGIEIDQRNHTLWRNTTSNHNSWLNSFGSTSQAPGFFDVNPRFTSKPTGQNAFVDLGLLNNREEICAREKHMFLDMWKNHEPPEQKLPPWLTSKPSLQTEQTKAKVHHINLDSLQNHSQQFFKKTENRDDSGPLQSKKPKLDDTQTITKILGVPIVDKKVENHDEPKDIRRHIDLNLALDEEDEPPAPAPAPPSFPESVVKIATMEIDLEAPAVLEPDPDDGSTDHMDMDLVTGAAEAIVSISCPQPPSDDTLLRFAEAIVSATVTSTVTVTSTTSLKKSKDFVPEDMDDFEYLTLNLKETEEKYESYKPVIVEEQKEEENGKRPGRKGQGRRGRQRRDFQKDVLPSIVSLSRREVSEDLQIFEDALSATGVCWQSSSSKRKAAARNGRGRRRLVAAEPSPPPAVCMEMSLEKGWGRRTRRLPRQRCQGGGGNQNQSVVLKC